MVCINLRLVTKQGIFDIEVFEIYDVGVGVGSVCAGSAVFGDFDEGAVGEGEIDVVVVLGYGAEHRVACIAFISFITLVAFRTIGTVGAIGAVFTVFAVCAGGFAELCPIGAIVGNVPIATVYFQLRGVAIDTVLSVFAIRTVSAVLLFMFISKYFIIKIKTYIFVYR